MSLLIKDMEMPDQVPLLTEMNKPTVYNCRLTLLSTGKAYLNIVGREEYPVEKVFTPHGRLIDADRLIAVMESAAGTQERMIPLSAVLELIKNSKTLIEAEEALKERETEWHHRKQSKL